MLKAAAAVAALLAVLCCISSMRVAAAAAAMPAQQSPDPCGCLNTYRPVCGGGTRFINSCKAECAGFAAAEPIGPDNCNATDSSRNDDDWPDFPDICTCGGIYAPVCAGRNFTRYFANACEARCAGFSVSKAVGRSGTCPPSRP
uniref:Kazal-like domain-containing protein n=1 Tax=Tetradesmus obliquus TaxID=3088 RepID=A0A383VBT9_TETOB|eukprot:jgi/Sobl393_1/5718/SZX62410.1